MRVKVLIAIVGFVLITGLKSPALCASLSFHGAIRAHYCPSLVKSLWLKWNWKHATSIREFTKEIQLATGTGKLKSVLQKDGLFHVADRSLHEMGAENIFGQLMIYSQQFKVALVNILEKPVFNFSKNRYRSKMYETIWHNGHDVLFINIDFEDGSRAHILAYKSSKPGYIGDGDLNLSNVMDFNIWQDDRPPVVEVTFVPKTARHHNAGVNYIFSHGKFVRADPVGMKEHLDFNLYRLNLISSAPRSFELVGTPQD